MSKATSLPRFTLSARVLLPDGSPGVVWYRAQRAAAALTLFDSGWVYDVCREDGELVRVEEMELIRAEQPAPALPYPLPTISR